MYWRYLLSGLLLWASIAVPVSANGLPKAQDDRTLVDVTTYPWSAIGRLNTGGNHCSSVAVGRQLILTAAHCLWDDRVKIWRRPGTLHFLGGYIGGNYSIHAQAKKLLVSPQFDPESADRLYNSTHDWALVLLEKDISEKVPALPLTTTQPAGGPAHPVNVVSVGFARDHKHALSADLTCKMILPTADSQIKLTVHSCVTLEGNSGGPLLMQQDDRWFIAAIHSARATRNGHEVSLASAITTDVLQNAWPELVVEDDQTLSLSAVPEGTDTR